MTTDDSLYLTDPVGVEELLDGRAELAVRDLARTARDHDVVLGEFVDEELLLCGKDPDALPDPHWTPRQQRYSEEGRAAAREAVLLLLECHGFLDPATEPGAPALVPPHSIVAQSYDGAIAALTWRVDVRGEGTAVGGAFLLPGDLALHDDIDEATGQHILVIRTREREAVHVAGMLDPTSATQQTRQPIVATTAEDLRPRPEDLLAAARTSSLLARVARVPGGGEEQAVTTYGTDDGLWVLQGRSGPEPVAVLQLVDDRDLVALAERLTATG